MDSVFKMVDGFIKGLSGVCMALLPLAILWYVLTGTSVLGMDVVANISSLLTTLTNGGFIGLIVLVIVCSFFTKK